MMSADGNYILVLKLKNKGPEFGLIKQLGYKIISFAAEYTLEEVMEADVPVEIDMNDEDAVLKKAAELSKMYNIISVFTLNEYRVLLGARIREALGLKFGISYQAAYNCRNKKVTRKLLSDADISTVKYRLIRSEADIAEALKHIPLPVVVKPSNDAGSKGVCCCQTEGEVFSAVAALLDREGNLVGQKLDEEILIEEFLEGPEFSVETYTFGGDTKIIAITAKKVLSPFCPTEIGHTVPASVDGETALEIQQLVKNVVALLGVDYSVTHIEVKLTPAGPRIIEVNARPGGDEIPALVEMTTGISLHKLALCISLGVPIESVGALPPKADSASIRFLIAESDGEVDFGNTARILDDPAVVRTEFYADDGIYVQKTTCNYDRLGFFIVKGDKDHYSYDVAEDLLSRIDIKITG